MYLISTYLHKNSEVAEAVSLIKSNFLGLHHLLNLVFFILSKTYKSAPVNFLLTIS